MTYLISLVIHKTCIHSHAEFISRLCRGRVVSCLDMGFICWTLNVVRWLYTKKMKGISIPILFCNLIGPPGLLMYWMTCKLNGQQLVTRNDDQRNKSLTRKNNANEGFHLFIYFKVFDVYDLCFFFIFGNVKGTDNSTLIFFCCCVDGGFVDDADNRVTIHPASRSNNTP